MVIAQQAQQQIVLLAVAVLVVTIPIHPIFHHLIHLLELLGVGVRRLAQEEMLSHDGQNQVHLFTTHPKKLGRLHLYVKM